VYVAVSLQERPAAPVHLSLPLYVEALLGGVEPTGQRHGIRARALLPGSAGHRLLLVTGLSQRFEPAFRLTTRVRGGALSTRVDATTSGAEFGSAVGDPAGSSEAATAVATLSLNHEESSGFVVSLESDASPYLDEAWRRHCQRQAAAEIRRAKGLHPDLPLLPERPVGSKMSASHTR
jgi:hypothetical protein